MDLDETLRKLTRSGIKILPIDVDRHYLFERDGFVALVQRRSDGSVGKAGAAGLLTMTGLAPLVWRGDTAAFASKAGDSPATPEQIEALRRFQSDLEDALLT